MKLSHKALKFGASFFENTLALGQDLKGVAPIYSKDLWQVLQRGQVFCLFL